MVTHTIEPLGRRRYWPIYEAAAAHGYPVGLHTSGFNGHAVTGTGWPSFYVEEHHEVAISQQARRREPASARACSRASPRCER